MNFSLFSVITSCFNTFDFGKNRLISLSSIAALPGVNVVPFGSRDNAEEARFLSIEK